jgi:hypothetical protein
MILYSRYLCLFQAIRGRCGKGPDPLEDAVSPTERFEACPGRPDGSATAADDDYVVSGGSADDRERDTPMAPVSLNDADERLLLALLAE